MAVGNFGSRRRRDFLTALSAKGNVSAAARTVGISRSTAYAARNSDGDFAAAWGEALEEAVDALVLEARRRAVEGVVIPQFYGGKLTGTVTKYPDSLLMFLLRTHRPQTYREFTSNEWRAKPRGEIAEITYHELLAKKLTTLAEQSLNDTDRSSDLPDVNAAHLDDSEENDL